MLWRHPYRKYRYSSRYHMTYRRIAIGTVGSVCFPFAIGAQSTTGGRGLVCCFCNWHVRIAGPNTTVIGGRMRRDIVLRALEKMR